jgi:hypothetical protein
MSENVFFEFKNKNVLDDLIDLFVKKGKGEWKRELRTEPNYLHKYYWPEIVLSDEQSLQTTWNENKNSIERLGEYRLRTDKDGQIVLFIPAIYGCINDFLSSKNLNIDSKNKYFEVLCELVLIHEFIHWLVDMGASPKCTQIWGETQENSSKFGLGERHYVSKLPDFKYDDTDSIKYHESFAQIFTNYYCNKIGGIHSELFEWLEKQQQTQYTVYKDLFPGIWAGRDLIIGGEFPDQKIQMIKDDNLEQVFDLLNFTRELNLQSFKVLEALSSNYSVTDKDNKCVKFFEKLNSLRK